MKDEEILRLYRERSETALTETERQYGALCGTIAQNILRNRQDAEECVNDTWHRAWNSIPPEEPRSLAAYLGRITRNLALNRLQKQNRLKRGGGEMTLIWEELGEMLPDRDTPEQHWERRAIAAALERFLRGLTPAAAVIGALTTRRTGYLNILAAVLVGDLILYAVGVPYMYLILHVYMQSAKTFSALLAAMLVYVPGDTLKIVVVTALVPVLRRTLAKAVPNL